MVTKPRVSLQERAGAPRRTNGGSTRTPAELSKFGDLRIESNGNEVRASKMLDLSSAADGLPTTSSGFIHVAPLCDEQRQSELLRMWEAENEMLEAEIRQLEDMSELRARLSAPQPDGVAEAKCGWESTHWWWGKAPPSKSSVEIVEADDDWKQDGTSERMQEMLQRLQTTCSGQIGYESIPWPDLDYIRSIPGSYGSVLEVKRQFRQLMLQWHEDKFIASFGPHLKPCDRERILSRVKEIGQVINEERMRWQQRL